MVPLGGANEERTNDSIKRIDDRKTGGGRLELAVVVCIAYRI